MLRKGLLFGFLYLLLSVGSSPAQIQVGDTLPFWSVSYIDWPPLWGSPQRQFEAVCLRSGQFCHIFSEVGVTPPSDLSLDYMVDRFDQNYAPKLTAKYGPIPDALDGDPHVIILWMNDNNWGGYFDPGQQMSDSMVMATWGRHSCEHEIIYIAAWGTDLPAGTVAHEFGHLLHWGQDHSPEPPVNPVKYWEDAWVDEGFSTFAHLYLDQDIDEHNVLSGGFITYNPDIPLIWFSDYNQVQLFMLYMYEHYGKWDYISSLISNQLNGIPGVEATLDNLGYTDNFNDAFANWCVANYIDDSIYDGGKYWYAHFNFNPAHVVATHNNFPTGLKTGTLTAYGSDYILLNSSVWQNVTYEFTGEPNKAFRLAIIRQSLVNDSIIGVIHLLPDSNNHIVYYDPEFGLQNRTILVPMCVDSTVHEGETAGYTYSVSLHAGVEQYPEVINLSLFPNPVADKLTIPWMPLQGKEIEITILDFSGREVIKQMNNEPPRMLDVQTLNSGLYFLRIIDQEKLLIGRFVKQ